MEDRMTVGSLFSGIGGLDLGLERVGMEIRFQVEIDTYCQKVLAKHWPNARRYSDVRECGKYNLEPVDLICGGFPCQPVSHAGQRRGAADNRFLWPEMLRIISELQPRFVVGENVFGLVTHEQGTLLANIIVDLETIGYEVAPPLVFPAAALGALHRRDRVWICAHSRHNGRGPQQEQQQTEWPEEFNRICADATNADSQGQLQSKRRVQDKREWSGDCGKTMGNATSAGFPDWAGGEMGQPAPLTELERPGGREVERDFRGVANGVSHRVDRLRCLGNAVVPQVAEWLGRRIVEMEALGHGR